MSANKFKSFDLNNLNPVITKNQENKEIQLLRQSFSKGSMNLTLTNFKRFNSNDKTFGHLNSSKFTNNNNKWHEMGIVFKNGFKNKFDKIKIKKKDKFFEELKNKRLIGNK